VLHGQSGTEGYQINSDIIEALNSHVAKGDGQLIRKSTFGSARVGEELKKLYDELSSDGSSVEIYFTGYCTGICVISNVVMAKTYCPEARVCVISNACACVTPETHMTSLNAMRSLQVDII
jgi:nicotinamidase-related amidase